MQLMRSSDGGYMHAYSESDIVRLEGLGWKRAKEGDQAKVVKVIEVEVDEHTEVLAPRRGRPSKAK